MADQPVGAGADSLVVESPKFAMVPQWLLDAPVSDRAVRLYAVLARYGQTSGLRMPSRALLAERLHKASVDTVDRALRELVEIGAVQVEHRRHGGTNLTNCYHLRSSDPGRIDAAGRTEPDPDPTTPAAHRSGAAPGGREPAARVAAQVRHDPDRSTQTSSTPRRDAVEAEVLRSVGITADGLEQLARQCQELRRQLGQPGVRWQAPSLLAALQLAVRGRGWPAPMAATALRAVAADPATRSPMRVAEAGPWWDLAEHAGVDRATPLDLDDLERQLDATDGRRVHLQRLAREQLRREGQLLTRATVLRRAVSLLGATAT